MINIDSITRFLCANVNIMSDIPFALTPSAAIEGVVDFRTAEGRKLYERVTARLSDILFDCTPENLFRFIEEVSKRGTDHGWTDSNRDDAILLIKEDPSNPDADRYNMLENYGALTMEELKHHEESIIFTESRAAQDNYMLYSCLMNSIDVDAKNKILVHKKEYHLRDPSYCDKVDIDRLGLKGITKSKEVFKPI